MSISTPQAEILRQWLRSERMMMRVALPGVVEKYDAAKQTVDVKPMIRDVFVDKDGGELVESLPVLPDVRVIHERGGGAFVAMPLKKGDFVQLLVNDRCLDVWRRTGTESDPADLRMHDLSDVVAFAGGYPDSQPLAEASATDLVMGFESGMLVRITPNGEVEIGAAGSPFDRVALASKVDAKFSALKTYVDAIQALLVVYTGGASPFSGGGLAAVKTAAEASLSANPIASTKVKTV